MLFKNQPTILAQKIGKQPRDVAPIVMQLLEMSAPQNSAGNPLIKFDKLGITPKEMEEWFVAFAKGVQYVHEKYGTVFAKVAFCDAVESEGKDIENAIIYHGNNDTLVLTKGFVAKEINTTRGQGAIFDTLNSGRHNFTGLELATLLGVEEAYHAYQLKVLGHQYKNEDKIIPPQGVSAIQHNPEHYASNALERDARVIVQQAVKDFGFGGRRVG
jgi:hypothetical protein